MKNLLLIILALFAGTIQLHAQENDSDFSIDLSADFVSRYVWRGLNLSESPAVQPTLAFTYKGVSFGSWASYTLSREAIQEVDLYLSYEHERFGITINNYFNTLDTFDFQGNYFNLSSKTTPHVLEALVSVYGPESFPLVLSFATMFYGNDRDDNGNSLYSSYLELSYPLSLNEVDANLFLGLTPAKGLYAEKFNLVNVGFSASRNIAITDKFSIPIMGSFIVNPSQEKVFLVLSITL